MGLRNPTFAQVISIVDYVGSRSEIENLVTLAAAGNAVFSEPVVDTHAMYREPVVSFSENNFVQTADETSYAVPVSQSNVPKQTKEPKEGLVDKVRNLFGSMFD